MNPPAKKKTTASKAKSKKAVAKRKPVAAKKKTPAKKKVIAKRKPASKKKTVANKKPAAKKSQTRKTKATKTKLTPHAKVARKLQQVDLFTGLSKHEIASMSRLMTEISVPEGKVLVRQGARGSEFMLIVSGKAIVKRNGRKIADLGSGSFVGELSILTHTPRYATVTATTDMVIKVLTPQEFMSMIDKSPRVAKKILIEAVTRLQQMANSKYV